LGSLARTSTLLYLEFKVTFHPVPELMCNQTAAGLAAWLGGWLAAYFATAT
jgi:hypothetical protein